MKASAIYRKSIGRALSGASHVITFVMRCALAKATSGASHVIFASDLQKRPGQPELENLIFNIELKKEMCSFSMVGSV